MKHRSSLAVALFATLWGTSAYAQLPDKNADRAGWIKASMEGKQAAFCGLPPKELPGGSDPDFVANQVSSEWNGQDVAKASLDQAIKLTNALCKFPGNPQLQSTLTPLWKSFLESNGLGAADFADFAAVQNTKRERVTSPERAPADTRIADADPFIQALIAKDLAVSSSGMGLMAIAELLDTTPNPSEHLEYQFVATCLEGSVTPGRWAVCKADALSLDRKRFDKELAAAKIDPRDRLQSKLRFAALQKLVKEKAAALAADAAKDRGVEKVIETLPAAAAKQWADDSAAHKELLAWTYKVIDDARANNKRLMEGCESALQTHLASYLKGKSFTDDKELQHALRDHIGSQLGRAAALCFVRNEAAQKFWSNWSTGYARQMGPRTLTWYAIASEKIEFDTNRDLGMPRPLILYANASEGRSSGTIDKVEDAGDKVKITFSATAWTETVCKQWKETNRIESIDFNTGKLIYRQVCVKTAKEKRSSKAEPVTVDKAFAEGLRAGVAATFARSSDGAGYPIAIYASKDRAKIVGAFGVMF